jgi:hypothetical protein
MAKYTDKPSTDSRYDWSESVDDKESWKIQQEIEAAPTVEESMETDAPQNLGDAYFEVNMRDFRERIETLISLVEKYQPEVEKFLKKEEVIGFKPTDLKGDFISKAILRLRKFYIAIENYFKMFPNMPNPDSDWEKLRIKFIVKVKAQGTYREEYYSATIKGPATLEFTGEQKNRVEIIGAVIKTDPNFENSGMEIWKELTKTELDLRLTEKNILTASQVAVLNKSIDDALVSYTTRNFLFWYDSLLTNLILNEQNRATTDWIKFVSVYYRPVVYVLYRDKSGYITKTKKKQSEKNQDDAAVLDSTNQLKTIKDEKDKVNPSGSLPVFANMSDKDLIDTLHKIDYNKILKKLKDCYETFAGKEVPSLDPLGDLVGQAEDIYKNLSTLPVISPAIKTYSAPSVSLPILPVYDPSGGLSKIIEEALKKSIQKALLESFKQTLDPGKFDCEDLKKVFKDGLFKTLEGIMDNILENIIKSLDGLKDILEAILRDILGSAMCVTTKVMTSVIRNFKNNLNSEEVVDLLTGKASDETLHKVMTLFNVAVQDLDSCNYITDIEIIDIIFNEIGNLEDVQNNLRPLKELSDEGNALDGVMNEVKCRGAYTALIEWLQSQGLSSTQIQCIIAQDKEKKFENLQNLKTLMNEESETPEINETEILFKSPSYRQLVSDLLDAKFITAFQELEGFLKNTNYYYFNQTEDSGLVDVFAGVDTTVDPRLTTANLATVTKAYKKNLGYEESEVLHDSSLNYLRRIQMFFSFFNNSHLNLDVTKNLLGEHILTRWETPSTNVKELLDIQGREYSVDWLVKEIRTGFLGTDPSERIIEEGTLEESFSSTTFPQSVENFLIKYGIQSSVRNNPRRIFGLMVDRALDIGDSLKTYAEDHWYNNIITYSFRDNIQEVKGRSLLNTAENLNLFGKLLETIPELKCVIKFLDIYNYVLLKERIIDLYYKWSEKMDWRIKEDELLVLASDILIIRAFVLEFLICNPFSICKIDSKFMSVLVNKIVSFFKANRLGVDTTNIEMCYSALGLVSENNALEQAIQLEADVLLQQFRVFLGREVRVNDIIGQNLMILNLDPFQVKANDIALIIDSGVSDSSENVFINNPSFYHSNKTLFFLQFWGKKDGIKKLFKFDENFDSTRYSISRLTGGNFYLYEDVELMDEIGLDYCTGMFKTTMFNRDSFNINNCLGNGEIMSEVVVATKEELLHRTLGLEETISYLKGKLINSIDYEIWSNYVLKSSLYNSFFHDFIKQCFKQYIYFDEINTSLEIIKSLVLQASEVSGVSDTEVALEAGAPSINQSYYQSGVQSDTFGLIKTAMATTVIQKMGAKISLEVVKMFLKAVTEQTDPNIKASRIIVDVAALAGQRIPIAVASLGMLLPVNLVPLVGWGPPITPLGLAYLGIETLEEKKKSPIKKAEDSLADTIQTDGWKEINDVFDYQRICSESNSVHYPEVKQIFKPELLPIGADPCQLFRV